VARSASLSNQRGLLLKETKKKHKYMISKDDKLTEKWSPLVGDPFKLYSVGRCNFKPHPFTIGPRHVVEASEHYGGILGKEVLEKIPCAVSGCGRSHSAHTSDLVIFLEIIRDCANKDAAHVLFEMKKAMEADGIDGVCFMEGPFKIAPPEQGEKT
jgi:hypothetical protein